MTRLVWVLVCLMFAGSATATAQSPPAATPISSAPVRHSEDGRPFIRAYRPTEVGGAGEIWSMLQDRRGMMYIGTNGAVLEFDGSSWRRIRLEPGGSGRSLALDASGRIYVGSASAFGYLAPDEHGDMAFVLAGVAVTGGRTLLQRRVAHVRDHRRRHLPDGAGDLQVGG
jgi:hypothetical protein